MTPITFEDGDIQIDAAIVAEGLGIAPPVLLKRMREGTVTSFCERGLDSDAGRHRLTFLSAYRRLSLVVDESGTIVERSMVDFGNRPRPVARRGPSQ